MLDKGNLLGVKIEIHPLIEGNGEGPGPKQRVYFSKVNDIPDARHIEILLPQVAAKLVLLPKGSEHDIIFYGNNRMYQCRARVVDHFKRENLYLTKLYALSTLKGYQRREYYRLEMTMPVSHRLPTEKEQETMVLRKDLPGHTGTCLDVSGGGLRFTTREVYEPEELIICSFSLMIRGKEKEFSLWSKVKSCHPIEEKSAVNAVRVKFEFINNSIREEIIQYIFEEERKKRNVEHK